MQYALMHNCQDVNNVLLKPVALLNLLQNFANLFYVKYSVLDNEGICVCLVVPVQELEGKHDLYSWQEMDCIATSVKKNGTKICQLLTRGITERLEQASNAASFAMEALIDISSDAFPTQSRESYGVSLIELLLKDQQNQNEILALMHDADFDEALMRAIICVDVNYKINTYFNINLNLGYTSVIDKLKHELEYKVRNNKYLNTQDFWGWHDNKYLVISKSFIKTKDSFRLYLAMDKICQLIEHDLMSYKLFDVKIAYGNLYDNIFDMKRSYYEAIEILSLGWTKNPDVSFYNIDTVMLDIICRNLHPQILNKIILPFREKLIDSANKFRIDLLSCGEAFIDNCMDYSRASKSIFMHRNTLKVKMQKLKDLSGLDPANDFSHAIIIKLLSVFVRQSADRQE
jgi:hypothetical protein